MDIKPTARTQPLSPLPGRPAATRTVTLQNPWGKADRMSLADFERRLMAFEQVNFGPGPRPARP